MTNLNLDTRIDRKASMRILAPAKINLFLKIKGIRPDGFHEIETLMMPLSLADELIVARSNNTGQVLFRCDSAGVPKGEENLVVRAAHEFFRATQLKPAVSIDLHKKIPTGAGLGGGSSDAAATLLALNRVFETGLSRQALTGIAANIGSDVPFFLFGSAALCQGRGEIVSPQPMRESLSLLLLKPDFGVPTAWAYGRWKNSLEVPGISFGAQKYDGHELINNLERPVFEKFVFLGQIKTWLRKQAGVLAALMSGSGSTLFAALDDNANVSELAERTKNELDPKIWTCACHTLT